MIKCFKKIILNPHKIFTLRKANARTPERETQAREEDSLRSEGLLRSERVEWEETEFGCVVKFSS